MALLHFAASALLAAAAAAESLSHRSASVAAFVPSLANVRRRTAALRTSTTNVGGSLGLLNEDDNGEAAAAKKAEANQRALLAARAALERKVEEAAADLRPEPSSAAAALPSPSPSPSSVRVGIAGAGAVAFGTAALLAQSGHDPMLWSPSGAGTVELLASESASASASPSLIASGAIEATVEPRVAGSAEELARDNDALLIALPAYGHRAVFDALAPHVQPSQHVIISSQASLGAVYLSQLLRDRGVKAPVTAWGTTVVLGRRTSGTEVSVTAVRKLIDLCTVPEDRSDDGLDLCCRLFGDRFKSRDGLLAISLSNLNPQNHMGIALANMSRMERGEKWSQGQNVTPNVGRLLEALDQERLDIADALGFEVKTIFEHFHNSFHVPIASISEMNQRMHEQGNGGIGPNTADSRYVTEDVPYGLALTVALGELTGRPAVLHEAGMRIFSAMYGRDFAAENELLNALNLNRFVLDDLQEASRTGLLPRAVVRWGMLKTMISLPRQRVPNLLLVRHVDCPAS